MCKKYLLVMADTNDANCTSICKEIDDETLELIMPVIEAIRNFQPYKGAEYSWDPKKYHFHYNNYHTNNVRIDLGEKTTAELYGHLGKAYEVFNEEYIPYFGYYGIRTIVSIEVIQKLETLL